MNLLIISDESSNTATLVTAAVNCGWQVAAQLGHKDSANVDLDSLNLDALVIVRQDIGGETIKYIEGIYRKLPLPIVVITNDKRPEAISAAVKAGVTSFVVDCPDPARIGPLLEVARVRFEEIRQLKDELGDTKAALSDRKHVDRAKGILMNQKNLSEDIAYKTLRKLAMDRNKRLGDIAKEIITAADVLI